MSAITGRQIESVEPGSAAWLETISASKIPAILGISPWQSPYSLWHQMKGMIGSNEETNETRRGHYLEPAVAAWFADQHPDFVVSDGGSWAHEAKDTWTAAPDRLVYDVMGYANYGVEIKSAAYADEWGKPGTAEIPPYYLAQVAWQMNVLGFDRIYVPIITGFLEFREYIVNREDIAGDLAVIERAVLAFEQSLADNNPPALDGSEATYQTVRKLHPDIDGEVIELDALLGHKYVSAFAQLKAAEKGESELKNQIAAYMGNAKKLTWCGIPLFTRQSRGSGAPYLVASKQLKTAELNYDPEPACEAITTTDKAAA